MILNLFVFKHSHGVHGSTMGNGGGVVGGGGGGHGGGSHPWTQSRDNLLARSYRDVRDVMACNAANAVNGLTGEIHQINVSIKWKEHIFFFAYNNFCTLGYIGN